MSEWKFKGLSGESMEPPAASDNSISPVTNNISTNVQI